MNRQFNTILIPVDFSLNTEVAIQKGIELCEGPDASIHLLHVAELMPATAFGYLRFLTTNSFDNNEHQTSDVKQKLEQWLLCVQKTRPDVAVCLWMTYNSSIERAIMEKAKSISADLIIIGKKSQHSLFPFLNTVVSSRIACHTGVAVLTVKPGSMSHSLKTVVVPIGSEFPEKKVEMINSLGNKYFIHVRLLILVERGDDPAVLQTSLLKICRVLKNRSLDNISYEVLRVNNKGADILNYCRKVDADLLIVHPESETRIGWFNKHISDELPASSKTQILAVSQSNLSIV